jgi:hypothetical protein
MANNTDILKQAFENGKLAFSVTEQNAKGIYNNPANPHTKNSLPYKEWERGFNFAYFEHKRKAV